MMIKRLFDCHCHIIDSADWVHAVIKDTTKGQGEHALLFEAKSVCVMSSKENDFEVVASLGRNFPNRIIPAFGIHPWFAHTLKSNHDIWFDKLKLSLMENPNSFVGEIGIDKVSKVPGTKCNDMDFQKIIFQRQWDLAVMLSKPVSIHCVKAFGTLYDFICTAKKEGKIPPSIMLHSYSGSVDFVKMFEKLKLPIFYSFSMVINTRGRKLDDVIAAAPIKKILIESDLHEPEAIDQSLISITELISKVKGLPINEVVNILEENFSASVLLHLNHQ